MNRLVTRYLGFILKNPVIVASSGFTATAESIRHLEEAGAGAVVLKSLFEEQIMGEAAALERDNDYPEAAEYLSAYVRENSVNHYLDLIRRAKAETDIPVIASINCASGGEWVHFAKEIERAGADALELNIFLMPETKGEKSETLESGYYAIAASVAGEVKIPVAVKLGNHFTNPLRVASELYARGVKGVVMFNRFYEPDIDIETLQMGAASVFSTSSELRYTLRWIAKASAEVDGPDYSASTGIHSGEDAVKMLLAGANTVQLCSLLYQEGVERIGEVVGFIREWMERHGFNSMEEVVGRMNGAGGLDSLAYERAQFMKYFSNHR